MRDAKVILLSIAALAVVTSLRAAAMAPGGWSPLTVFVVLFTVILFFIGVVAIFLG